MKTINILILIVSLFFFCQLHSYGQKGVKTLPLKYKGIKLNYDFKNILPRIVREYNNHYFVATERAIYEFSKEGKLITQIKLPKEIEIVFGFYLSSKSDFFIVAQYSKLFIINKSGVVKKKMDVCENFAYLNNYGFYSCGLNQVRGGNSKFLFHYVDEDLKASQIKIKDIIEQQVSISDSMFHGIVFGSDGSESIVSYKLPDFKERKIINIDKKYPRFTFWHFIGKTKTTGLFFSSNSDWNKDTLKVFNFEKSEVINYVFKFKQPKLRLQNEDNEVIGYTHPRGHFIDFKDEKLLVLTNTIKGSFVYEVEY